MRDDYGMPVVAFKCWLDAYQHYHVICGFDRAYIKKELTYWLGEMGGLAGVW